MSNISRQLILLLLAYMATSLGCEASKQSAGTSGAVWMETEPVQCLGNPWEEAWINAHNGDYDSYPTGDPRQVEKEEAEIIKSFFAEREITIIAVESRPFPEDVMVCDACSCPQGYTLYVRVKEEDAAGLEQYDFKPSEYQQ